MKRNLTFHIQPLWDWRVLSEKLVQRPCSNFRTSSRAVRIETGSLRRRSELDDSRKVVPWHLVYLDGESMQVRSDTSTGLRRIGRTIGATVQNRDPISGNLDFQEFRRFLQLTQFCQKYDVYPQSSAGNLDALLVQALAHLRTTDRKRYATVQVNLDQCDSLNGHMFVFIMKLSPLVPEPRNGSFQSGRTSSQCLACGTWRI